MQHIVSYDWFSNLLPVGLGGAVNIVEEEDHLLSKIFNRPGVAGAVLQTAS